MTQATDEPGTTDKDRRPRPSTWVAVSAIAAMMSAVAAMLTAGAGLWRPPVTIPAIKITLVGPTATAAPRSVTSPSATPTAIPTPVASEQSYQANWSQSIDGWVGAAEWKWVPGQLVADGSSGGNTALAPFHPSATDYAIEATIQASNPGGCSFGIVGRSTSQGYYIVGQYFGHAEIWTSNILLQSATFGAGTLSHVYRAEFRGDQVTLIIDGNQLLQVIDNQYLTPGQVGLASIGCQLEVSSFRVTPLGTA